MCGVNADQCSAEKQNQWAVFVGTRELGFQELSDTTLAVCRAGGRLEIPRSLIVTNGSISSFRMAE